MIHFPTNPTLNQLYQFKDNTWRWNGTGWSLINYIQGIQGVQGIIGAQGVQGIIGAQGVQGIIGAQGVQGLGIQGIQGLVGLGLQGITGIQGPVGIQGLQGVQGIQGIQGIKGIQGIIGTQGIQGTNGLSGIQGVQGIQGILGFSGVQGIQGVQGVQGVQGPQGSLIELDPFYTQDKPKIVNIIRGSNANPSLQKVGDLWFNTNTLITSILHDDGSTKFWVPINTGGGGSTDIISTNADNNTGTIVIDTTPNWQRVNISGGGNTLILDYANGVLPIKNREYLLVINNGTATTITLTLPTVSFVKGGITYNFMNASGSYTISAGKSIEVNVIFFFIDATTCNIRTLITPF